MSTASDRGGRPPRHRLAQALTVFAVSAGMLWLVITIVPGLSTSGAGGVAAAAVVIPVASALLRPVLGAVATTLGWLGVVLVGLVGQAVIFYVGLTITPGISVDGFWSAFWASWLYALFVAAAGWLFDAGDDELFLRDVVRQARRAPAPPADEPGMVIVQIDGLPAPLLRWAVRDGQMPNLSRWIRSGSHQLAEWHAELPATTPASQAGILHGRSDAVPAFRWYEKDAQRLTVSNHPRDAAYIERGMSDGNGLLAGGGASVGNIFTGDAATSLLTMSAPSAQKPSRSFAAAYLRPFGMTRAVVLTVGEMVKELYQGQRQVSRDVQPRIDRRSSYVALRGVTNVLLRDLNVRLLAEQMMAGTPVMYCDFTDYDEVAHHAGPGRPESLASLAGVDRAIGLLERVAHLTPRPYHLVVLSDHGQSQGATFLQRYGVSLEQVVQDIADHTARAELAAPTAEFGSTTAEDEQWGRVGTLVRQLAARRGPTAALCRRVVRRQEDKLTAERTRLASARVIVAASGNLGLVYFPRVPHHVSMEQIDHDYPGFLDALVGHDGVGFAVVRSEEHGTVVLGADGVNFLDEHRVEGHDPLAPFGRYAAHDVARHSRLAHVGDVVVNSRIDATTDEVAAFEELVGCHGGLGGWQSEAVLVHPTEYEVTIPLVGADAVHRQLRSWLSAAGHRPGTVITLPVAPQRAAG